MTTFVQQSIQNQTKMKPSIPTISLKPAYSIQLFFLYICFFSPQFVNAQTLSPSVLPSAGGYFSAANGSLSWTLGETVTPTLQAGSNILTQGFQQPEVQVRTGTITGPFCPGGSVIVPFLSSGIISASNVYTAQLSNASGNFGSAVSIGTFTGNASSGSINAIIPLGTPNGAGYRIRVVSSLPAFTGPDNGTNLSIVNTCSITLNLTLFLQGYYTGSSTMAPTLFNESVILSTSVTDTIIVELHQSVAPYLLVSSSKVLLNTDGTASCSWPVAAGNYYVAVKHRNTVQTWSASPISISSVPSSYNFSNAVTKAYGSNMAIVSTGVWAFYSGDINQEENIDLLDAAILETDISDFAFGYFASDINGDGNVDLLDSPLLEENINAFVFSVHP